MAPDVGLGGALSRQFSVLGSPSSPHENGQFSTDTRPVRDPLPESLFSETAEKKSNILRSPKTATAAIL